MLNFPRSGKPDATITVAGYPGRDGERFTDGGGWRYSTSAPVAVDADPIWKSRLTS
jgi:hypothetical protein